MADQHPSRHTCYGVSGSYRAGRERRSDEEAVQEGSW